MTGGQYSLFRASFGIYLLVHFLGLAPYGAEVFSGEGVLRAEHSPLIGLFPNLLGVVDAPAVVFAFILAGAAVAIPFAIGWHDRPAAIVLWYVWACLYGRNPLIANPGLPYVGWMLIAHVFTPPAPYGSWARRREADPGWTWRQPRLIRRVAWFLMAAGYTFSGITKLTSPSWIDGTAVIRVLESPLARPTFLREAVLSLPAGLLQALALALLAFEILFLPLSISRRLRPILWAGMLAMHAGLLLFVDFADLTFGMVMLHLFTFDPRWLPPKDAGVTERVFYDGACGLCHRTVRMILSEDALGTAFRFAPLGSETFTALASEEERRSLPDSIVVQRHDGRLELESAAVLRILERLGGFWRIAAVVGRCVPRALRDRAYGFVARVRHRVFPRPDAACPILPKPLMARFDP
jgi:predicted DCC family thiol-disulfide oxidoreductase YuxK